jgi:hypothetical protein
VSIDRSIDTPRLLSATNSSTHSPSVQPRNAAEEWLRVVLVGTPDEAHELNQRRPRFEARQSPLLRLGFDCLDGISARPRSSRSSRPTHVDGVDQGPARNTGDAAAEERDDLRW